MGRECGTYGGEQLHMGSEWGNLEEKDQFENQRVDGKIIIKLILKAWVGNTRTGFNWLQIRKSAGPLQTR